MHLMTYIGYPQSNTDIKKNSRGPLESPAPPNNSAHSSESGGIQCDLRFISFCNSFTTSKWRWLCASISGVFPFLSRGSNSALTYKNTNSELGYFSYRYLLQLKTLTNLPFHIIILRKSNCPTNTPDEVVSIQNYQCNVKVRLNKLTSVLGRHGPCMQPSGGQCLR